MLPIIYGIEGLWRNTSFSLTETARLQQLCGYPWFPVVTTALGHLWNKGHSIKCQCFSFLSKPRVENFLKDGNRTIRATMQDDKELLLYGKVVMTSLTKEKFYCKERKEGWIWMKHPPFLWKAAGNSFSDFEINCCTLQSTAPAAPYFKKTLNLKVPVF